MNLNNLNDKQLEAVKCIGSPILIFAGAGSGKTRVLTYKIAYLIKEVGFVNSYSYIFSPRPGTPSSIKELNNPDESRERLKRLQNILTEIQIKDNQSYKDKYCEVLVENKLDNQDMYFGRTKYTKPVIFDEDDFKIGDLITVKISSYNKNNLFGVFTKNKVKAA